jgi:hypothetical protein
MVVWLEASDFAVPDLHQQAAAAHNQQAPAATQAMPPTGPVGWTENSTPLLQRPFLLLLCGCCAYTISRYLSVASCEKVSHRSTSGISHPPLVLPLLWQS